MKDKKIKKIIKKEEERQQDTIDLIASENYVSRDVREASASVFTNKYSEGYPGKRYYAGNSIVDELETLVQERALKLFGLRSHAWGANAQALSGAPANIWAYFALVPPGGKLMGQALDQGGHLTHGSPASHTSTLWRWAHYGVDAHTYRLDYDAIMRLAKKENPKVIVAGTSAYSRRIDFKRFRAIADAVGAYLLVDMSHIAGLVAGGAHPSPFPYADVVTTTTHKTLRGPRGALLFFKKELEKQINASVFPKGQGGPHQHQTAAIGVALYEAMQPSFRRYAKEIIKNADALSRALKNFGYTIITGGTDTHLFLIDISQTGVYGKEAQTLLERAGIIVNMNSIPFDSQKPFNPSGVRIGTPAVTTRGMKAKEMKIIAGFIHDVLQKKKKPDGVRKEVKKLCAKFPVSG
ncbi:MAG: serine hydroxymethyltransferase [bacterium]|nr:serine hydroxymethyltransferase [bacterium]